MRIVQFGWLPMFKILFICNMPEVNAEEGRALCPFPSAFFLYHDLSAWNVLHPGS